MNEFIEVLISLAAGLLAGVLGAIGGMAIFFNGLSNRVSSLERGVEDMEDVDDLSRRLVAVETRQAIRDKFFDELDKRIFTLLHSPDDHLGLDKLIDKYRSQNHELSVEDWTALKFRCDEIFRNESLPKDERLLASLGLALCEHKLQIFVMSKEQPAL